MLLKGISHLCSGQARHNAKLAIAEAKSQGKLVALANPYNGNEIEPDDGASTLVQGRPWA